MITAARSWFNSLDINYQLLMLITGLNVVDFQTTKFLVDKHGFVAEANPLLLWAMIAMGTVYAILAVKVVIIGILWWVVSLTNERHETVTPMRLTGALWILTGAFFALITWNFFRVFQELGFTI